MRRSTRSFRNRVSATAPDYPHNDTPTHQPGTVTHTLGTHTPTWHGHAHTNPARSRTHRHTHSTPRPCAATNPSSATWVSATAPDCRHDDTPTHQPGTVTHTLARTHQPGTVTHTPAHPQHPCPCTATNPSSATWVSATAPDYRHSDTPTHHSGAVPALAARQSGSAGRAIDASRGLPGPGRGCVRRWRRRHLAWRGSSSG